jgi:DNA (cytosine-5)-methyltransferase 1
MENRPLSVRECARIQGFPDDWGFSGSVAAQYRQIGNATPIALGEAVGRAMIQADNMNHDGQHSKRLLCADAGLLERIIQRPRTLLNPRRMRIIKDGNAARKWLNTQRNRRTEFEKYEAVDQVKRA